jgi:hypothetical protein
VRRNDVEMYLTCEFKECIWNDGRVIHTCFVKLPDITEPSTRIKAVSGKHQDAKSIADVKELDFNSITVNFIPRGLGVFFPNLTYLQIYNCGLKSICREDLTQFPKLEGLWIRKNELITLPDDLFEDTKNLKKISFYCNKIEFMSSNLFKPIIGNKLEYISFGENTKIDAIYSQGWTGNVASVPDLMTIIDANCSKPPVSSPHQPVLDLLSTHSENLFAANEALFTSWEFSDFSVIANGSKIFKVHRCILAAHIQGFADLFRQEPVATEMKIEDLSAEAVEVFLRFLYTGKLEDFEDKSLKLFAQASKLKVPDLGESLLELVVSQLDESNAFRAL